jgi:hypothetical protein
VTFSMSACRPSSVSAVRVLEWGMLRRTIHAARYLSEPPYCGTTREFVGGFGR